ncbi:MAG: hypothetical protein V3V08_17055 [Nannocystaceae bacterium]
MIAVPLAFGVVWISVASYRRARLDSEWSLLVTLATLAIICIVAACLAVVGHLEPWWLAATSVAVSLALWAGSRRQGPQRTTGGPSTPALTWLILASAVALRLPSMSAPLGGRDQGTYTLRAQHTLRTGELGFVDPILARAGAQLGQRSGPADLLGLYADNKIEAIKGQYEAAYRPGAYLSDRDRGRVSPQFLHGHPMLMTVAGFVLGPALIHWWTVVPAIVALWAFAACSRRLWGHGPWSALALAIFALSPIAIWVHRTPLSESIYGALIWGSILAVLRARAQRPAASDQLSRARGDSANRWWVMAGFLAGSTAWIRGDAWFLLPVLLCVLWMRHSTRGRAGALTLLATLMSGILLHSVTSFPYVFDELRRVLPSGTVATPARIAATAIIAALSWIAVDVGLHRRSGRIPNTTAPSKLARVPVVLGVVAALVLLLHAGRTLIEDPAPPYSRLDTAWPLLGAPVISLAAVGAGRSAWRFKPGTHLADVWTLAMATIPVVLLVAYAPHHLPQRGLYYYGRYLVPVLLPVAILAATEAARILTRRVCAHWPQIPPALAQGGSALVLLAHSGYVLIARPNSRLNENMGAGEAVAELANRLPANAVVIAGGEGWLHGHAFNQVGGALAFRYGFPVLPYHSQEAFYATLHELLLGDPQPQRAVYLLLNEATRGYDAPIASAPSESSTAASTNITFAVLDDLLPAPFRARDLGLLDLYLHRLTPTTHSVPTRVTRASFRMALARIEIDPAWQRDVQTWKVRDGRLRASTPTSKALALGSASWLHGYLCLDPNRPLRITLPSESRYPARSLVLVATPGTAPHNYRWKVRAGERGLGTRRHKSTPRARDTLGPFPLTSETREVTVRGAAIPVPSADCPHGGISEIRLLPPDRSMLATTPVAWALTRGPPVPLGPPPPPTRWVAGRSLSRYRVGIDPIPTLHHRSMILAPGEALTFAPIYLPQVSSSPRRNTFELVIMLTQTHTTGFAQVVVTVNDNEIARIPAPSRSRSTWQSEAVAWQATHRLARVRVELRSPDPADRIHLRDLTISSGAPAIPSIPQ